MYLRQAATQEMQLEQQGHDEATVALITGHVSHATKHELGRALERRDLVLLEASTQRGVERSLADATFDKINYDGTSLYQEVMERKERSFLEVFAHIDYRVRKVLRELLVQRFNVPADEYTKVLLTVDSLNDAVLTALVSFIRLNVRAELLHRVSCQGGALGIVPAPGTPQFNRAVSRVGQDIIDVKSYPMYLQAITSLESDYGGLTERLWDSAYIASMCAVTAWMKQHAKHLRKNPAH